MVSSRITLVAALMLAGTFVPAYASTVLHITGRIVEDPCNITPTSHTLAVTCPQNTNITTQQVRYSDALYGNVVIPDRATISMKYVNPQKSLAIVQVDYR